MSVDEIPPPRMPQPEQWLSEHPGVQVLAFLVLAAILAVVIRYG